MSISDAESLVMDVLWADHPLSADDVVATLKKTTDWQEPTIRSLLNRLLRKGAIAAEREGRRYLYRPVVSRAAYLHAQSKNLLDRLFGGRLAPMVAHFSEHGKLSRKDLAELKRLIREIDDDG